ncbi:MAG: 50S ribosome-binding GTPase [Candidatus Heimdallarchaeota archaeon]|nr:MAG: 50S ribosome-binding GTPase [Candidatus Heimdallarchaeota archaeon]
MPINLNREAQVEWDKYLEASSIDDQIFHLERFLGVCVKHKGVEKHLAMAKTKLKKLKAQKAKLTQSKKGSGEKWLVPKGEDAQIAIIGNVNSGKSSVLNELARSDAAKVGSYPFTTVKPEVGSTTAKGARLQLVELPAVVEGSVKGEMSGKLVLAGIRNADCVLIAIDLSEDPVGQLQLILEELKKGKIRLNVTKPPVSIEKVGSGNIQVFNDYFFEGEGKDAVIEILRGNGYLNAIVRFHAPVSLDQFLDALDKSISYLPAIIIATKGDIEGSRQNYEKLLSFVEESNLKFQVIPTSVLQKEGFEELDEIIFNQLGKIRVFTRNAKGDIAERPIILRKGSTVENAIEVLSKKMLQYFRFTRIWGRSAKFDGEKVGLDRELQDGDVIQVFA